ncbi:MAG TPA: hypothetical protein VL738_32695 [Dactylosporangium sp.]|jgi:hypothetical protein|nr:hypothetical protein [Dactylosporangium sp.]
MDKSRASAVAALLVTAFAVVYAAGSAVAGWEPSSGWLLQALIHLGELAAVAALALSDAAVRGRLGRAGLAVAAAGQAVMVAAEIIWPRNEDLGNALFGVGPILTGAGLIAAGVTVVRARAWSGAARFLPIGLGTYTIFVLIPVMIGSGGPPAPLALWTIAGWDAVFFALAACVLARAGSAATATPKVTVR